MDRVRDGWRARVARIGGYIGEYHSLAMWKGFVLMCAQGPAGWSADLYE
jgi:hypothetical protein